MERDGLFIKRTAKKREMKATFFEPGTPLVIMMDIFRDPK
ncbi:hypothetical protein DFR59_10987 [Falsibacillus pallidus]|uniref:Uncharacterized protein n=1 Tax=Falsibacillus pallidus TaxID=493781 RepID=A0A370GBZ5_9BACI|nr:hypothetical protein DFR59_10987 [Falsibacillus pallidus]